MWLENKLQAFLWGWTILSFLWWLAAFVLLRTRRPPTEEGGGTSTVLITIFKPSPSFRGGVIPIGCLEGLRSFLGQMSDAWELLLGIDPEDRLAWDPFLKSVAQDFPHVRLTLVEARPEILYSNQKVNWQKVLAPYAKGNLWFWSDLDIQIPPGGLEQIRREWECCGKTFVSCAYRIRKSRTQAGGGDALFVNAEFLPGVYLLGRSGKISTGFGAGFLFDPEILKREEHWAVIGNSLADDRALAQLIGSGKLSSVLCETAPAAEGWTESLLHYWRWQKTIHWCDPVGSFGRGLILPLLGWAAAGLFGYEVWNSLVAVWLLEMTVGAVLLWQSGFQGVSSIFLALGLWPILRMLTWILVWLPLPVRWGKLWWWNPFQVPVPQQKEVFSL